MNEFQFEVSSLKVAKELIREGFDCRAVLGSHDQILFMFERSDQVRRAYREAKDKVYGDNQK